MKPVLFATAALLLASCAPHSVTRPAPKFIYDGTRVTIVDTYSAGMQEVAVEYPPDPDQQHGGNVYLRPLNTDQYDINYSEQEGHVEHSIMGSDFDAQGVWNVIEVCGYQQRHDHMPSHCNAISRTDSGSWRFYPCDQDIGMIDAPTQAQIDYWSGELHKALVALQSVPHNKYYGGGS